MADPLEATDARLGRWSLEFVSPSMERVFAARTWPAVARQARAGVIAGTLVAVGFVYSDFLFFGAGRRFLLLLAARLWILVPAGLVVRSTLRSERPARFDVFLALWTSWAGALLVGIAATRPSGYQLHGLLTVVSILAVYQLIPLRFRAAAAIAAAISAGYCAVVFADQAFSPRQQAIVVMTVLTANTFGVVGSRWLHGLRRLTYAAQREAERANASKSLFVAMTSHELRTPLNSIFTCAELLGDAALSPPERRYLEMLRHSGKGMLRLADDLLELSRVEAGGLVIAPSDFEVRPLLDEAGALARGRGGPGGGVAVEIDEAVPTALRGDPARIRQILVNLIENALKFGDAGSVRVAVRRLPEKATIRLLFEVIDRGPGIPLDQRAAIFEPFVQGASRRGGSGLGLAICKKLVEAMGGIIGVDAAEDRDTRGAAGDRGSRFWFTLDLSPGDPAPSASSRAAPIALPALSLLLVEDDPVSREVTAALLAREGHAVVFAGDGSTAVEAVRRRHFDGVLIDLQLPIVDGREATQRIRALARAAQVSIPIIALTASALADQDTNHPAAGFDRVLGKPLDPVALGEALRFVASRRAPLVDEHLIDEHADALSPDALAGLAQLFAETTRATLTSLRAVTEAREPTLVAAHAHRLASAALSLGLSRLGHRAAALEAAAREGRLPSADELSGLERLSHDSARRLDALAHRSADRHADPIADAVHCQDDPRGHDATLAELAAQSVGDHVE